MIDPLIVWNVRGMGTSRSGLKNLVSKYKPKIVVVLEPFQNFDKAHGLMRNLHFDSIISNEAVGGKIWVLWENTINVQVVQMSLQFISLCFYRVLSVFVQFYLCKV